MGLNILLKIKRQREYIPHFFTFITVIIIIDNYLKECSLDMVHFGINTERGYRETVILKLRGDGC